MFNFSHKTNRFPKESYLEEQANFEKVAAAINAYSEAHYQSAFLELQDYVAKYGNTPRSLELVTLFEKRHPEYIPQCRDLLNLKI
jgi:hypothetical protein